MSDTQCNQRSGGALSRRIALLCGAVLASVALLTTASSASAEPVGLFVGGAKSEEVSKQPKFEAEKYTANVGSTSLSSFEFISQAGTLKCFSLTFSGTLPAASSELKLSPFFSNCSYLGFAVTTVETHGCEFKLHALNAGPPYVGSTDVQCPSGEGPVFTANFLGTPVCTLQIRPQTGVGGIALENTGTGSSRAITTKFNLTTMTYVLGGVEPKTCKNGEYANGTFKVNDSLSATK